MIKLNILIITVLISTAFGYVIEPKVESTSNIRIVGGSDAVDGQFPYQVSLRWNRDDAHECGGSIINSKWILTAAHCLISGTTASMFYIYAGNISLSGNGVRRQVSQIISHPDYGTIGMNEDIALLELEEELEFSVNIQPIELETEEVGAADAVLSGWGLLGPLGPGTDILQYIPLRKLTQEECVAYNPSSYSDREVCTLNRSGEGVCYGDSGGPLVVNGRQVGVVSYGQPPCASGFPDFYNKVSSHIDWIEENITN